jgi:hypothetical protein
MLPSERSNERLLALVLIGTVALNYPFLSLFSNASMLFGIPVLYLYLFLVWSGFIYLTALIVARKGKKKTAIEHHGEKRQA